MRHDFRVETLAAAFIDRTLRSEGSDARASADAARIAGGLRFYGASVGAVRGAVRDARRRHPELSHDEVTALASELWAVPVYERRLAAVVLLQGQVPTLLVSDFTRLEQLLRSRARESSSIHSSPTSCVRCSSDWTVPTRRGLGASSIGGRTRACCRNRDGEGPAPRPAPMP